MDSVVGMRLRFSLWKAFQAWHIPEMQQKEQEVIAKPIYRAVVFSIPSTTNEPGSSPVFSVVVDLARQSREPSPVKPKSPRKTKQEITLDHLLEFKAKHEKMPFVLAWSIVYQNLVLGSTTTGKSKSLITLKKINTQEKLEEDLVNAGLMSDDMVHIEGLIAHLNLRGDQPKRKRPSMI